jgi:putative ABC transport system permease protein
MLQDVRFALRQLLKTPGFFAIAVLTLALAIGANTAIFSAIDAVLLHPLSYPDPDRLVILPENITGFKLSKIALTAPEFEDIRRWSQSFSAMAAMITGNMSLTGDGTAEDLQSARITTSAFPMLGVNPVAGGFFSEDNERTGNDHVALISRALWIKRFGGDRSIIGRKIQLNRESYQVLGVIDPILDYRVTADVYVPLAFVPNDIVPGSLRPHIVDVVGRLKPGVSIEQARDEFRRIAKRFGEQYPDSYPTSFGFSLDVDPLAER